MLLAMASSATNGRGIRRLEKLYLLIHGFCYAGRDWNRAAAQPNDPIRPYLARERACAEGWYSRLEELSEAEALVIIPAGREGPAADYYARAVSALGDRCFILDCPDCLEPEFWVSGSGDFDGSLLKEIETVFVHQQMAWNKEELHTALHCRACCRRFHASLEQRGYSFDPKTVRGEAWGASFDGCVTKYTLYLRRILGLSNAVDINFSLTVPDAAFLLNAAIRDCVLLDNRLRLFLFEAESQVVGLYTFTEHSLADQPSWVSLAMVPETATVRSKQGIRLWPRPEEYALPTATIGCYEPPQVVVQREDGVLQLPVSAGLVYRLAKAPAYLFMPSEMSYDDARSVLISAKFRRGSHGIQATA
jgi:hypothetical protein